MDALQKYLLTYFRTAHLCDILNQFQFGKLLMVSLKATLLTETKQNETVNCITSLAHFG